MKTIVFDLDDTLYPELRYVLSGFDAVARWAERRLGIARREGFAELRDLFDSGARTRLLDGWLAGHGVTDPAVAAAAVDVYRGHDPSIRLDSEVAALLFRLKGRYLLGLVSDGRADTQRKKLRALGLGGCFHHVVFSDDLGRDAWKPNPLPFKVLLDVLEVAPHDAVYVADNPGKDFLGARRAGLRSVRVRLPEGVYSHLEPATPEHAPDAEIDNVLGIEGWLDKAGLDDQEDDMPTEKSRS